MKRTFHLFSIAAVLTLIISLLQATSAPAQIQGTLTPTEVTDPGATFTPTQVTDLPPTYPPPASLTPTPLGIVSATPTPIQTLGAPVTWTVTSLVDATPAVPGNCPSAANCRLRDAIAAASTGDIITFDPSLSGQVIVLGDPLALTKDVTIDGSSLSGQLSLSLTGHNLQILNSTVTISNLIVQGGSSNSDGGAIWSDGNLTLINSTVRNSHATGSGGGIYSLGTLIIRNSAIYGNGADLDGGGIYAATSGKQVQIANSTISTNYALRQGGAIYSQAETVLSMVNATIAGPYSGSISQVVSREQSQVTLVNSIVACWYRWITPPATYADCYDFIQPPSITNSILGERGKNYGLAELAENGGPTETMAASQNSPVVDAGDDAVCASNLINNLDQRGAPRPHGSHCDIGAYEVEYLTVSGNVGAGDTVLKYGYGLYTAADQNGDYAFKVLPGWSGTIIPTKLDYSFTPSKMKYTNVQADQSNQNYSAAVNPKYAGKSVATWRASVSSSGGEADNESYGPSISADGRYAAYWSFASNLVAGQGGTNVIVYDNQTGQTTAASVDSNGVPLDCNSANPSISADGRYVAFYSCSGGGGSLWIVYVYDRHTGILDSVARGAGPSISADGRYVAYISTDNSANQSRIIVQDLLTRVDTQVSLSSSGGQPDDVSTAPFISANGRYIAFASLATNLVANDTNGVSDIFVYDVQTGMTRRVSVNSNGSEANGASFSPSLSEDGRYVAFHSAATNLVDNDTNGKEDVFVHDLQTGETTRVSVSDSGAEANGASDQAHISADGNYVAFRSYAANLASGDTNQTADIFVYDRQTMKIKRLSVASDGAQANGDSPASYSPGFSISADGKYIAFPSDATNLVSGDTNGVPDIFVHQRQDQAPTPTATSTPASSSNLVLNPGFETAGTSAADAADWTEGTNHVRASDKFHTGGWALHSTFRGIGTDTHTSAPIVITPNTTYIYSGYIWKTNSTGAACLDMNDIAGERQLCASASGSWQYLTGIWNSGSNTSVTLRLITDGSPTGDIWFDDISLVEPNGPTNTPPAPTNTPTETSTPIPPTATNTPSSNNLVLNPGFEKQGTGGTSDAANWIEGTKHVRARDKFHTGGWALHSTYRGGGTDTHSTIPIAVRPNTTYTYSGYIWKTNSTGAACLDMNDIAGERQLCATSKGSWQFLSGTWNSGSNTSVTLRLITDGSPTGDIWFDDISLK